jgi:alpha/beta superfamily hydrolase
MHQQPVTISGPAGAIEAVLHDTDMPVTHVGIICHPHPLQEGTMHNKVVTTVARTFNNMGITALRFNYRGVGLSEGKYGDVTGEVDDCLAVVTWALQQWPHAKLWLAGFSFGAYIAAATATKVPTQQLISIAPAVERMPYTTLAKINCPWLVIQGEDDDVVTPQAVYDWFETLDAQKTLVRLAGTGHFFHGKLMDLRREIEFFTSNSL